ncbi:hypothetical protein WI40_13400 [Burkholderia ubonensis]|uniref:hypothetical protein n=1 Tax=Burkholderia ubonensis TaxID=101571 RepID=UPI0007594057|nr:hypothetical protein [Burkholderia ubonensis]KUZ71622.1 hypothetical protein WI37_25620 [Burkholderia ubonensis]KUZ98505.1 hypothetical protein WI40_13400 [Burkholderia ubonensis]
MNNPLANAPHPLLPGPFAAAPSGGDVSPTPAVSQLVSAQVRSLLEASPAFYSIEPAKRAEMQANLEKIAAYTAALIQDEWLSSQRLGQTPVLRQTIVAADEADAARRAPVATSAAAGGMAVAAAAPKGPAADEFSPRAANQAARITRDTLNAIAFPTFVADLIKGTFQAIVDASIRQMEAYGNLLSNVAKTVDQFMADNVTDNNARDYLAGAYPGHFKIETDDEGAHIRVRDGASDRAKPDFKSQFSLESDVDLSDEAAEQVLVPAARRHMARSRQQMLSTMVLMGINRIVVTSGRIAAKMGFRIDTKDQGHAESASQFDWQNETNLSYGGGLAGFFGGPSGSMRNSIAYVSSSKKDSSDDIDVHADLTGEVDLKFKSDYFPMERFAKPELMALIQGHTPNPAANAPVAGQQGDKPAQPAAS